MLLLYRFSLHQPPLRLLLIGRHVVSHFDFPCRFAVLLPIFTKLFISFVCFFSRVCAFVSCVLSSGLICNLCHVLMDGRMSYALV